MSSDVEVVDVLSRVANIFIKAVDALETRMMNLEQRIEELERALAAAPAYGRREPAAPVNVTPSMTQDSWRTPPAPMPPQQPQRAEAYGAPQQQWGGQRQESYPPQPSPSYQTKPQPYPPQQQQQQPTSYPPPAQSQGTPYGPPGSPGQAPPMAGPPRPSSPLNLRQAVTGELKEVFAKMRARAEGR